MRIIFRITPALAVASALLVALPLPMPAQAQNTKRAPTAAEGVHAKLFEEAENALRIATEEDAAILAPISYAAGLLSYQQAEQKFQQGGRLEAIRAGLQEATQNFQKALAATQWAGQTFTLTLTARDDARHAEAPTYASELWHQTEARMRKAARALEEGNLKSALKQAPALEQQYRQTELVAIQKHPRQSWQSLSTTLDEQHQTIAKLKQEISSNKVQVNSLQQQMSELEKTLVRNPQPLTRPRVEHETALQAYFSKEEATVFRRNDEVVIRLFELDFFANTAKLSGTSAEALGRASEILAKFPRADITVAGHAYSARTQAENLKISRERAESVKAYLRESLRVVQPLVAVGYGDTAPIPKEELLGGPVKNERVDVIVELGPSQVSYLSH